MCHTRKDKCQLSQTFHAVKLYTSHTNDSSAWSSSIVVIYIASKARPNSLPLQIATVTSSRSRLMLDIAQITQGSPLGSGEYSLGTRDTRHSIAAGTIGGAVSCRWTVSTCTHSWETGTHTSTSLARLSNLPGLLDWQFEERLISL